MKEFFEALKNDPEFYRAYQANIAMAFKDNVHWAATVQEDGSVTKYIMTSEQLHEIANDSARYFLNLLIKE